MNTQTFGPIDSIFEGANDSEGLRAWLMRAYFNPTKHQGEPYFSSKVSKENVLEYISGSRNKFPQTPSSIVGLWNMLPSLRSGLRFVSDDDPKEEKERINTKGERTLNDIGDSINVTATMVNKISDAAVTKLSAMLQAITSENNWLADEAKNKIDNAFLAAAEAFADATKESRTPNEILSRVVSAGFLSAADAVLDEAEQEGFSAILEFAEAGASQADIEDVYLEDLKKQIGVFNTLQMAVARQVFPPPKLGRPRKN